MSTACQLAKICQRHQAILLSAGPDCVRIAIDTLADDGLLQALRFASQLPVEVEQWTPERMEKQRHTASDAVPTDNHQDAVSALESLLQQAISRRASDIHIEPGERHCQIRLRSDGTLQRLTPVKTTQALALSTQLKILAGLDIAERRIPQDGQFSCEIAGITRSFRLSTLPCQYGEKLVLRLLESHNQTLGLDMLGLNPTQL